MTSTKHGKGESPFQDDLSRNPGIGQSKGTTIAGADPDEIEGENTVEGDVDNDVTGAGAVKEHEAGRTNA
jgi:hypothetical protein